MILQRTFDYFHPGLRFGRQDARRPGDDRMSHCGLQYPERRLALGQAPQLWGTNRAVAAMDTQTILGR